MKPLYLLMGIHHHQPVGNFDSVFKMAFEKCYRPLLDILERHPSVRISLHHSGPLIDWARNHEGNYLERVVNLSGRGQIEILGGGYYEPILPILKPGDALGQIEMMQNFWEKKTGRRPRGMWLAERVWEPSLAALLHDAKMEFTILDDQHFRNAGLTDETLFGYFRTERAGKAISVFPSDKTLRYLIPFKEPQDVVGHLLYLQSKNPGKAVVYGDDGEKFGVWPGTYEWVLEKGWLERFFTELEKHQDQITTTTFSDYKDANDASGMIYLPTSSYSEMLEWAMPAPAILSYEQTRKSIENAGLWENASPFFRGGFWDNFLTKYPESNLIHKRALHISDKLDQAEAKGSNLSEARESLYRSQCNCAYWHGLFGGLYLNYLRHALYTNMIEADIAADRALLGEKPFIRAESRDIDCDGLDEAILSNESISCIIKPSAGGSLVALDYRPKRFNLMNTLARRFEAYHEPRADDGHGGNASTIPSIHELGKDIGALRNILTYDRTTRSTFLDHAFESEPNWNEILVGNYRDDFGFDTGKYELKDVKKIAGDVHAVQIASSRPPSGGELFVEKEIRLKKSGRIEAHYRWWHRGEGPPQWLATEINFTLLAGHDKDRYYLWDGIAPGTNLMDSRTVLENVRWIEACDRAFGFKFHIAANADKMLVGPVETVSQSEKGFDRMYQGSNIWIAWKPNWSSKNESEFLVGISVEAI